MCQKWNLELVAMVGVGSQEATGDGATACVCQVPVKAASSAAPAAPSPAPAASGSSSGISRPLLGVEAAMAAKLVKAQQQEYYKVGAP
jgi:hypothetical protein